MRKIRVRMQMKKEAMLYEKLTKNQVHCFLCGHQCKIAENKFGVCGVRQNIKGQLYSHVYGDVIASHIDPVEKKPLYHFLPGTLSYSIAAPGCNFRCGFCQNWQISQLRTNEEKPGNVPFMTPEEVIRNAQLNDCQSISYTYTEPTIFFEYAYDVAVKAKNVALSNIFVTNGFMSKEAIELIHPYLDAANVDLKSFREDFYVKICHGHLKPVLESIHLMKELGIWVEITTLIVPGKNDSEKELTDIASFIALVGKEIPWHISRFHPDYQFNEVAPTPVKILEKAKEIGEEQGLRYVYVGNVPNETNDTVCPECHALLVKRSYMSVKENKIVDGKCPQCGVIVDGKF
jgi:pyruvate formate lyase activating enzyme